MDPKSVAHCPAADPSSFLFKLTMLDNVGLVSMAALSIIRR